MVGARAVATQEEDHYMHDVSIVPVAAQQCEPAAPAIAPRTRNDRIHTLPQQRPPSVTARRGATPRTVKAKVQQRLAPQASVASSGRVGRDGCGGANRRRSIMNAVSFAAFLANVVAAVVLLVFFTQIPENRPPNSNWVSLAIDKSVRPGQGNLISPLVCTSWSREHCGEHGQTFGLARDKGEIRILQRGLYRIYLMATTTKRGSTTTFALRINGADWVEGKTSYNTSTTKTHFRCFLSALRFMHPNETVAFSCSDPRHINPSESITYFGLERL